MLFASSPAFAQPSSLVPLRVAICFEEPLEGLAMAGFTKEGKAIGYLPDLAAALADYLDRPLRILPYTQAELYTSLERGEADIVIYPGSPPPGLAKHLALSQPWSGSCQAVLAPRAVPVEPDVQYFPVVHRVKPVFTPAFLMPARNIGTAKFTGLREKVRAVADLQEGLSILLSARVKSSLNEPIRFHETIPCLILPLREALLVDRKHPELRVLGVLFESQEPWQFALSAALAKDQQETVDQFIAKFRLERGFVDLERKHLADELKMLRALAVPSYSECRCYNFQYVPQEDKKTVAAPTASPSSP